MSDPIEEYLASLDEQELDPVDQYLSRNAPRAEAPPEERSALRRVTDFVKPLNDAIPQVLTNVNALLNPFAQTQDDNNRRAVIAAGILDSALLKPLQGILGIPNMLLEGRFNSERSVNFVARYRAGLLSTAEEYALRNGTPEENIALAYETGNFIGFVVPTSAAVKGASLALRAPLATPIAQQGMRGVSAAIGRIGGPGAAVAAHIERGTLVTDMTAGAIYGLLFQPADSLEERGKNMLNESAMFGVGRVILNGTLLPYRAHRLRRLRDIEASSEVDAVLRAMEEGFAPLIRDAKTGSALMQMLSEEHYLSTSYYAQEVLERSETRASLVQGIIDASRANGTGGRLSGIKGDFAYVTNIADEVSAQFPSLKFEVARNAEEGYDVIFGLRGLNNKQRAQLKREGRFEGQKVYREGTEYEYVGPASRPEYSRIRSGDGKVIEVKKANLTDLPRFNENFDPSPDLDELFEQFAASIDENMREVSKAVGGIPEDALIRAVRTGSLKATDQGRRAFDLGGAIVYPEELGIPAGRESLLGAIFRAPTGERVAVKRLPDGTAKMITVDAQGKLIGEAPVANVLEGLAKAQQMGLQPMEVVNMFASLDETARLVSRRGIERASLLQSPTVVRFEDVFDRWAAQNDLVPPTVVNPLAPVAKGPPRWLPPLGPDVEKGQIERAWNEVSARYPRLIERVKWIEATNNPKHLASWNEKNGILRIKPGVVIEPEVLIHELTHAAQGARRQLTSGTLTKQRRADLEIDPTRRHRTLMGELEPVKDYEAAKNYFATRYRQRMWQQVPEDEKKVFEAIRNELNEAIEQGKVTFNMAAHQKGFHANNLPGGKVLLRDINSGQSFRFENQQVARQALAKVVRDERDMLGGMMGLDSNGMPSITGGGRPTDGHWTFGPQIFAKEHLESIPFAGLRNVRDWLQSIENSTGMPLFTRGFNDVDTGLSRMRSRYEPWANQIQGAWTGLSMDQKFKVVDFWRAIEGSDLSMAQAVQQAKSKGLTTAEIRAFTRARGIWDAGFKMAGIEEQRFVSHYYGRVRPWIEANNATPDFDAIFGSEGIPREMSFFAEMTRTGEMSLVEMDPEIVMHKWFRSMLFSQEVKPHWDRLAQLVDRGRGSYLKPALRIRDLPQAQIDQILSVHPGIDISDPVLAKPVRDVISEYLTIVRGDPGAGLATLHRFGTKFFNSLGVKADHRVMEEFFNTYMSNMYGAAMAARPSLVARNMTQTIWNQYTRNGSRHMNTSLNSAMSVEGFNEAFSAGAIRAAEAGVPYGDAIFQHFADRGMLQGTGPVSNAIAAAVRKGLRLGYVSRKLSEKLLIPYSSGEQMSRAWSYHWQKQHTARFLDMYETKRISWERFADDGLPFFGDPIKSEFEELYRLQGKEAALRFIGKMGADETHFIYGVGAQPAWMQKPVGRLFGMFGTWPLWAIELYGRRTFSGSGKQQAAFWARTLAMTGAFANMQVQSGIDLWNWISPLGAFGWTGGPAVDFAIDAKRVIDAPMEQKAAALSRFATSVGRLSLPGQMFYNDIDESLNMDNPRDAFFRMMMGRPVDQEHYSMSMLFSGDDVPNYMDVQTPEVAVGLNDQFVDLSTLSSDPVLWGRP